MVKRGGTLPRYDWDDKRDICHKLYVEEKKSIAQVVQHFAELFKVDPSQLPSKKVFHRQFTEKWGFPKRRAPLDENVEQEIATTMQQMWAQNVQLKDIHQALIDQGHELNQYDFNKLRKKYSLNRRGDTGYTPLNANGKRPAPKDNEPFIPNPLDEQALRAHFAAAMPNLYPPPLSIQHIARAYDDGGLPANSASGQTAMFGQGQAAPQQPQQYPKVLGSKRRKRVHGFGDDDDQDDMPNYGSETSLDECKDFLGITDNDLYLDIRAEYDAICREMNIDRKRTSLADGRWQESKDRLVRNNKHLAATMNPLQDKLKQKELALDLICADVTKRLRDGAKNITVAQANNLLGLNPAASKEVRRLFYDILDKDGYTTRDACGEKHWQELQLEWYESSPLLLEVMTQGNPEKVKAVRILCRDASKRFNDDKARKDPSRKQYTRERYGPGPGAATHRGKKKSTAASTPAQASPQQARQTQAPTPTPTRVQRQQQTAQQASNFDAAAFAQSLDPALMPSATTQQSTQPATTPIPAYFRLDATSNVVGSHPRLWLGRLEHANVAGLKTAAVSRAGPARVRCIDGTISNPDKTEDRYRIDNEDELQVYLEAAGSKATFLVALDGGYA